MINNSGKIIIFESANVFQYRFYVIRQLVSIEFDNRDRDFLFAECALDMIFMIKGNDNCDCS